MSVILKNKLAINIALISAFFALSVIVRLDNLKAPLGRHHEWITAHVLNTVSIFETNGAAYHHFSPVLTFNNPADIARFGDNSMKDKNGYAYYTSYPPFGFLFPYFIFKATGTHVSVTGIRVIGVVNQFLCALLILLIFNRMFGKDLKNDIFFPSYMAYTFYLFASGNLWFHGNLWFADMLVQLFVLGAIYVFISVWNDPVTQSRKNMILLFGSTFLGAYTEYLALFVAFFMGLFLLVRTFKNRNYLKYLIVLATSSVLALGISVYQYSSISSFEMLKVVAQDKYKLRSGFDKGIDKAGGLTIYNKNVIDNLKYNYGENYFVLFLFLYAALLMGLILFFMNLRKKKRLVAPSQLPVLFIVLLSILLHHIAFFNFTVVHDFSTLKTSTLFVFIIVLVTAWWYAYVDSEKEKKNIRIASVVLIPVFIHFSMLEYYRVNRIGGDYLDQKVMGEIIASHAKKDEMVFIDGNATPIAEWYAQRNITSVGPYNTPLCLYYLRVYNNTNGILFHGKTENNKLIMDIVRMNTKGDTVVVGRDEASLQ